MSKTSVVIILIVIVIIVLMGVYYYVSVSSTPANLGTSSNTINQLPATNSVRLGSSVALGSFLVDANGKTLYYFANDVANKSNCVGQCSVLWPPFNAKNISVPNELSAVDFGQITTSSGGSQVTYRGWPLYYYSGDQNPGDTNGQGIQNIWFVAANPFYNVMVMNNSASKIYLTDASGKALYYYKNDVKGTATADPQSKCTGQCLTTWVIFDKPQIVAPSSLNANNFKEFIRPDGQVQLSYDGLPLYLYSGDIKSGDAKGNGLNNIWYLVKP